MSLLFVEFYFQNLMQTSLILSACEFAKTNLSFCYFHVNTIFSTVQLVEPYLPPLFFLTSSLAELLYKRVWDCLLSSLS